MDKQDKNSSSLAILALLQGLYLFLSGIWPIVHIQTFTAVTGSKADIGSVQTLAVVMIVIGAGLCAAGIRKTLSSPVIIVAVMAAIGFFCIDAIHVVRDVVWPVYMVDVTIELVLLVLWMVYLAKQQEDSTKPQSI